jgi:hypothetical protein
LTFPDLDAELDRMFPGWRTWDLPNPPPRPPEEVKPTLEDQLRKFIKEQEEKNNV